MNRNGGAGEGPVAVLEQSLVRLGVSERLTLGLGGFGVFWSFFPRLWLSLVRGQGYPVRH